MGYKVLVVDDEPSNLHVMRTILQDHYTLIFAKNGERAIELALSQKPDLILLDVMMPGMNGYEACRAIKGDPTISHIPIVIVSALDEYQSEVEGLKSGAVDFLIKPVSPELVKSRIGNLLGQARIDTLKENCLCLVNQLASVVSANENDSDIALPRIAAVAEWLAMKSGCTKAKAEDLRFAIPLMSIGHMVAYPELEMDPEELGLSLVSICRNGFLETASILLQHRHERWDGQGGPVGLVGDEIPEESRILAVVQALDSELGSLNTASLGVGLDAAVGHLDKAAGTILEPRLVHLVCKNLGELEPIYQYWLTSPWQGLNDV